MKGQRAVLVAVVIILILVAGWWLFRSDGGGQAVDLVERFDAAGKRPDASAFSLADVTLNGETKRAIAVQPLAGTRLIFKTRIPDDAWLDVSVGLKPEAWQEEGDGVLFYVGVSDGRAFEPLFSQHVNPFANEGDRKWIPLMVDLSAYAGEEVDLIFNTTSSQPGKGDNRRGDLGVWGAPRVVVR